MRHRRSIGAEAGHADGLFALAAISIVFFWRYVPETFDLTKIVVILVGVPALFLYSEFFRRRGLTRGRDRMVIVATSLFLVALMLSALLNPSSQLAWIGQEHRYTGSLFWVVCVLGAAIAYQLADRLSVERFARWVSLAAVPFLIYSFIQMADLDPFRWGINTFNSRYVFSTQGNPNFASWTCALVFACGFILAGRSERKGWYYLGQLTSISSISVAVATVSIQGVVGIAFFLAVLIVHRVVSMLKRSSQEFELGLAIHSAVFVIGYFYSTNLWIVFTTVCAGFLALLLGGHRSVRIGKNSLKGIVVSGFLGTLILVIYAGERLLDWADEQFGERRAFYSAAVGMVRDSPVWGHGFDRYGRLFTRYRPDWHAETLQGSVAGSAHSIWLGLLVSGGLFLFVPLFVLFVSSLARIWKEGRAQQVISDSPTFFALVLMLSFLWLVSVEQASIIFITLIFVGLGLGTGRPVVRSISKRDSRVLGAIAFSVLLTMSIVSFRWIEGNKAQSDAYRELYGTGNIELGLELMDKAVRWGPHPSETRAIRANIFAQLDLRERAVEDANWVVEEYEYSGMGALESAKILLKYQEFARAEEILVRAIRNNKNNALLVDRANEALAAIRQG